MKKFISVLMALAMVLCLAAPTTAMAASDEGAIYVNDWERVYTENLYEAYQQREDRLYLGQYGCYGLKPQGTANWIAPGSITFYVDVETAGIYTIACVYAAKDKVRAMEYLVNDSEATYVVLENLGNWNDQGKYVFYVELEAGENEIVFRSTPDYDDSAVKTPNIYGIEYSLKKAADVEEPTVEPTVAPTVAPTEAPKPTEAPVPTVAPTEAPKPTEAPAPTTAPVEKDPVVVEGTEYVVKAGDTLSAIAAAAGVTVKELVEANKIENPDVINVGLKLVIPTVDPKKYIVKKGDTLSAIAKANGCKLDDILKLNTIENPDVIIIGDIIVLP